MSPCLDCLIQEKLAAQLAAEAQDTEKRRQAIEQERRDRELALRLAQEDQDQVEDVTLPAPAQYVIVSQTRIVNKYMLVGL